MGYRVLVRGCLMVALLLPALAAAQQRGAPDPRQLEARIERLERLMDNQALLDMMRRLEALEQEMRALRGHSETSQNDLENLRNRQRDLYLDVDRRLQALEEGGVSGDAAGSVSPAPIDPTAPVEPPAPRSRDDGQQTYRAAFDLLRDGRYEQSITAFRAFLKDHPRSPLAANAQYWLGEAKYVSRDFEGAITEFGKVIEAHPESNKVADALLKLGFAHYELGQWNRARENLEKVRRDHAGSSVAQLAEQRLQRMRDEGR